MPSILFAKLPVAELPVTELAFTKLSGVRLSLESFFYSLIPNVMDKPQELAKAFRDTLKMVGISGVIAIAVGLLLGVLLQTTKPGNVLENKPVQWVLDK